MQCNIFIMRSYTRYTQTMMIIIIKEKKEKKKKNAGNCATNHTIIAV